MPKTTRHREVRETIQAQINAGELAPGDRLPSERELRDRFGYARSVIRQALASLVRDGLVMAAYPHGYYVVGARIPWLSRLRLLSDEPWRVEMTITGYVEASQLVAEALQIPEGASVIERVSVLSGACSGRIWGRGAVRYPADRLPRDEAASLLLDPKEITYDQLEAAYDQRIISYNERIIARMPTHDERQQLSYEGPLFDVRRITQTTSAPISFFRFVGRSDCFEADYLIQGAP